MKIYQRLFHFIFDFQQLIFDYFNLSTILQNSQKIYIHVNSISNKKRPVSLLIFSLFLLGDVLLSQGETPNYHRRWSLTSVFGFRLAISGESPRQLVRSDPYVPTAHIPVFSLGASLLAQEVLTSTLPQDVALLVEVP